MSNIVKRNGNQDLELDPLRTMRELLRWDPFRTMAPMMGIEREWMPTFEIRETPEQYVFRADVPGMKQDDVQVSLTGNRLQITGKRDAEKETKDETVYLYERSFGSFARSFTLPDGIDAAHTKSELKDGVLTIAVPKLPAAKPQKIEVKTGTTKS